MIRNVLALSAFALVACQGAAPGDCAAPTPGTWEAAGSCFGMSMTVTLAEGDDACAFTLEDWSMDHGDAPDGGSIDGDAVSLTGEGFDGCTGTLDGDTMSGICGDGCAWELVLEG